jgi:hypothetical protein
MLPTKMKIKNIQENNKDCDANILRIIIIFEENITKENIFLLAKNKQLIFNEQLPIPYFKIISQSFIIRGSIGTDRISVDFSSIEKQQIEILMGEIINEIQNEIEKNKQ